MTHLQIPVTLAQRINVDAETGCWVWNGGKNEGGYGRVRVKTVLHLAHRLVYSILVGDPGPRLDHHCFNHACVNPGHLRPVTTKQNQEHREGAQQNNLSSRVRGVTWHKREGKWMVQVGHSGQRFYGGYFTNLQKAESAAVELRAKLFTHDDGRVAS